MVCSRSRSLLVRRTVSWRATNLLVSPPAPDNHQTHSEGDGHYASHYPSSYSASVLLTTEHERIDSRGNKCEGG